MRVPNVEAAAAPRRDLPREREHAEPDCGGGARQVPDMPSRSPGVVTEVVFVKLKIYNSLCDFFLTMSTFVPIGDFESVEICPFPSVAE